MNTPRPHLRTLLLIALLAGLSLLLAAPGLAQPTAHSLNGVVFFDADGNGQRQAGEAGIGGVVIVLGSGPSAPQYAVTGSDGSFTFSNLVAGDYSATATNLPGYVNTTPNQVAVSVSGPVAVSFGHALAMTVTGTVFEDLDGDGDLGLTESGIPGAVIEVYTDADGDGLLGPLDVLLASGVSDEQGNYVIGGLAPGLRVLYIQLPSGYGSGASGGVEQALPLISSELGGNTRFIDWPLLQLEASGRIFGAVWHDANGNEEIDIDETPLPAAGVILRQGGQQVGYVVASPDGQFSFDALNAGDYALDIDAATVPPGWVISQAPETLAVALAAGVHHRQDIGLYDPLLVAALRVAEWKREFKQAGRPHYTLAELTAFVAAAEAESQVFAEAVDLQQALLGPARSPEERARKEFAALRLNLASARLLPFTPVDLPALTSRTTVGGVVAEIEALLWPPAAQTNKTYDRLRDLAKKLNKGEGVGYGAAATVYSSSALYGGKQVSKDLKPGGGVVDVALNDPLHVLKWSPGKLDAGANLFRPKLLVRVKSFHEGGVVDVFQVLPDGRTLLLGVATPPVWNKDVNMSFSFDVRRVATVGELASTQFRLVVRDPDDDLGPIERARIDAVEVGFEY